MQTKIIAHTLLHRTHWVLAALLIATLFGVVSPPASTAFAAPTAACTTLQPNEAAAKDAWINQEKTTENKNDSTLLVKTESGKLNRSLVQFNLASLPSNAKITSAVLSLYVDDVRDGNSTVQAHRVTNAWSETGVTWNSRDKSASLSWTTTGGDYDSAVLDSEAFVSGVKDYWATFNVTNAAQVWVADPANNHGVILEAAVTSPKSEIKFLSSNDGTASERPKLDVCYSIGVGISPDNLAQANPGDTKTYKHTVTVKDFTNESVGLTAVSNQGWTTRIYADTNGDGVKDNNTIISQTPAMGPNGSYGIVVELVVPAGANNGVKDIMTVTATGFNQGTTQKATNTTQIGYPPVPDPVLDGKRDDAYTQNLESNTQSYCDVNGNVLAKLMTLYDLANPDYVWVVLEMERVHSDNTYGVNSHPSWGGTHSLGSLLGSDKGQVILRDSNGNVVFDVTADYVEDGLSTPSGYGSAGVTGGEGSIAVGSASQVAVETSTGYSLNKYCNSSASCNVSGVNLFQDSPPQNNYVATNPAFSDWQFSYLYEFRFDASAFGSAGFGSATINNVHVSPNKVGSNEILVTPCNGSIGDRVWLDHDGDKTQEAGEPGINGVLLQLYQDNGDGNFDTNTDLSVDTMFTAGDGDYDFKGLGPATYWVNVVESTIPAEYVLTTANEPLKVTLAKGQDFNDADFGYRTLPGLAISKQLSSASPAAVGQNIQFTIRITNTGNTIIDVLPLKDYFDPTVLEFVSAAPPQSAVSGGVITWNDLTTTAGNLAVGQSTSVVVTFKGKVATTTTVRAAEDSAAIVEVTIQQPAPRAGTAVSAEPVVDGLLDDGYTFVARSNPGSDAPGNLYKFIGASQCYFAFVGDRAFNDNVFAENDDPYLAQSGWDSHTYGNLDGSDEATFAISYAGGSYEMTVDYITEDNGNYIVESFDAPINNAKTSMSWNMNDSGWDGVGPTPQYNGDPEFHSPPYNWNDTPGQYWEWHILYEFTINKSSLDSTCGTVELAGAHYSPDKDNDTSLGTIGDYVWVDSNGDGIQNETNTGIPNVRIYLKQGNTTIRTTETEPGTSGYYLFNNVPAGNYTVDVDETTVPVGYTLTTNNEPKSVTLSAGQDYLQADFGYVPGQGKIGDRVYYDLNGDGGSDNDGEPGLNGVKVNLYQGACPTGAGTVFKTQTTSGNGDYLFTNLPAGQYCVNVDESTLPAGVSLSTANEPHAKTLAQDENYLLADFGYRGTCPEGTLDLAVVSGAADQYGNPPKGVSDDACVQVKQSAAVIVTKQLSSGDPAYVGQEIQFTIRITNTGDSAIDILPLDDYYDTSKLDFIGASPATNDNTDDGTLRWSDLTATGPAGFGQNLAPGQSFQVILRFTAVTATTTTVRSSAMARTTLGGVDLGDLTKYLFFFADARDDANWQGATKGFVGDVAVDGIQADERTSGGVPYAGTIYTNDSTLSAWQAIVTQNSSQATGSTGQTGRISGLEANLVSAFQQINSLPATAGYTGVASTSLNNLNTQNNIVETFVINVTSGLGFSSQINITGDAGDIFILRWDTDGNPNNGYQGQVKPQSGGAIVPLGGLKASNFIHVAGDINSSGGGGTPTANGYPQGPRQNNGQGALITGGSDFGGGGFFTGYWLTTGSPNTLNPSTGLYTGPSSSLSNGIFVGGWYSLNTSFSMTSGTSGVYVAPPANVGQGSIGDRVYSDTNGDGGLDNDGEPGINGVKVNLYQGSCPTGSGTVYQFQVTSGNGGYLFTNLPAGQYCVNVDESTLPVGYTLTTANEPHVKNLAQNENYTLADFGYLPPAVVGQGSIGDRVYYDLNGDGGLDDDGEPGLNSVKVNLYQGSCPTGAGTIYQSQFTSGNGGYLFRNLPAGSYCVNIDESTLPGGVSLTTANEPHAKTLGQNENYLLADFGYRVQEPEKTCDIAIVKDAQDVNGGKAPQVSDDACVTIKLAGGAIGDFVWYDTDSDGIQDVGEPGIPNVTLNLYKDANNNGTLQIGTDTLIGTQTTDADGGYLFTNLGPGTYFVDVTDTNGRLAGLTHIVANQSKSDPTPAIVLGTGEVYKDADFGYVRQPGSGNAILGDTVWYDDNGDGFQQPGEPGIAGVEVCATPSGGGTVRCATTNSNGIYLIVVPAGTYNVAPTNSTTNQTILTGLTATTPVPHGPVTVTAGQQYLDADFGYNDAPGNPKLGTIGNLVFNDPNKDGIFNTGDTPLAGVSVSLIRDTDNDKIWDSGEPIIATTTTGGSLDANNGNYLFTGVPAGNYLVHVSDTNAVLIDFVKSPLGVQTTDGHNKADPFAITLAAGASNLLADFGYYQSSGPGFRRHRQPDLGGNRRRWPFQSAQQRCRPARRDGGSLQGWNVGCPHHQRGQWRLQLCQPALWQLHRDGERSV